MADLERLRAELDEARSEADRILLRATRMSQIMAALAQSNDLRGRTDRAALEMAEVFSADMCLVLLGDEGALRLESSWGLSDLDVPDGPLAVPPSWFSQDPARKVVLARAEDVGVPAWLEDFDSRHLALVPLDAHDRRLGLMCLIRRYDLAFERSDEDEVRAIASRVALAIENARLHQDIRLQVETLHRVQELTREFAGLLDTDEVSRTLAARIVTDARATTAAVYLEGPQGARLAAIAGDAAELPRDLAPYQLAQYQREPDRLDGLQLHMLRAADDGDTDRPWGWLLLAGLPDDDEARTVLGHLLDVAALVLARAQLHATTVQQARHDVLTGLPNRMTLSERAARALVRDQPHPVAMIFCDLDRFKSINDTLGHEVGDAMLVELAHRLRNSVRPEDVVARFGGDEFVVLCETVRDAREAVAIADGIAAALAVPIEVDGGVALAVSMSQGIALGWPGRTSVMELLRDADTAMYRAKERGRKRIELFDESIRAALDRRLWIERELREALAGRSRIRPVFQPVWGARSGVDAVEVLLRVSDREGTVLPTAEVVQVAEESDLIVDLGRHMTRLALEQAGAWCRRFGGRAPQVLVNLSARELADPALLGHLERESRRTGAPLSTLGVELTERVLIDSSGPVQANLAGLHERGVGIGIDDFGTGFASLSYLKRFPVSFVKIDRSFVDGVADRPDDRAICDAVVSLSRALGLRSVAEGVETPEQYATLIDLGCDRLQGYLLAAPMPAQDATSVMEAANGQNPLAAG